VKAKAKITLERIGLEASLCDATLSGPVCRMGWMYGEWIAEQARNHVIRENAVKRIGETLDRRGTGGTLRHVNRCIRIYQVAHLFGYKLAKTLPLTTLLALTPLIKRNSRTELWAIRAGLKTRALALWQRIHAEKLSAAAAGAEVDVLQPPRNTSPSRRKPAKLMILKRLSDLTIDDLVELNGLIRQRIEVARGQQSRPAAA
jgi:hypothetical protein